LCHRVAGKAAEEAIVDAEDTPDEPVSEATPEAPAAAPTPTPSVDDNVTGEQVPVSGTIFIDEPDEQPAPEPEEAPSPASPPTTSPTEDVPVSPPIASPTEDDPSPTPSSADSPAPSPTPSVPAPVTSFTSSAHLALFPSAHSPASSYIMGFSTENNMLFFSSHSKLLYSVVVAAVSLIKLHQKKPSISLTTGFAEARRVPLV
jgi:hypothetical protein